MTGPSIAEDDPFAPAPPDEIAERAALVRALELSHGFTLIFACCHQSNHRDRLMDEVVAQLPELRVQLVALRQPVRNLLDELRGVLASPLPGAIFVYGIEGWLTSGAEAEDDPFVRNLNATRNHFLAEIPCPVVMWLPQHILATLARSAPDFCSVRSGIYSFCATAEVRDRVASSLISQDMTGMAGLPYHEKLERIDALGAMLAEYEALPWELRDLLAESRLLDSLATLHQVLGDIEEAETLFKRALQLCESSLGPVHPGTAASLNNLAVLLQSEGRYAEAEPLLRRALEIDESSLNPDHPATAVSLGNLALLHLYQGHYAEAEPLCRRALVICEATFGPHHDRTASIVSVLAGLYRSQGRNAEAEPLFRRVLEIEETSLGFDHPFIAVASNNLALLLESQGRYVEAESLYIRALKIRESSLGPGHPDTVTTREKYADLLYRLGRETEASMLSDRADAARHTHARRNAKTSDEVTSQ